MTGTARDRLTAAILLAVSGVWIVGVLHLVPDVQGAPTSPRTFPLAMGVGLGVLALLLLAGTVFGEPAAAERPAQAGGPWIEVAALAATFGFLIVYVLLLPRIGFVLATIVATAAFLVFVLRKRTAGIIVGMPLGLAFGIWLVLGKLMGVYLPRGDIVSLF